MRLGRGRVSGRCPGAWGRHVAPMGVRQHCMWVWVWVWVGMRSVCVCTPMHAYLTLLFCPPHPLKHTPHTHRMQMVVVPLPPGRLAVGGPAAAALLDLLEHQRELQVCVCGCMCVCVHVAACMWGRARVCASLCLFACMRVRLCLWVRMVFCGCRGEP